MFDEKKLKFLLICVLTSCIIITDMKNLKIEYIKISELPERVLAIGMASSKFNEMAKSIKKIEIV